MENLYIVLFILCSTLMCDVYHLDTLEDIQKERQSSLRSDYIKINGTIYNLKVSAILDMDMPRNG